MVGYRPDGKLDHRYVYPPTWRGQALGDPWADYCLVFWTQLGTHYLAPECPARCTVGRGIRGPVEGLSLPGRDLAGVHGSRTHPRPRLRPCNGFEDREAHRDPSTPRAERRRARRVEYIKVSSTSEEPPPTLSRLL